MNTSLRLEPTPLVLEHLEIHLRRIERALTTRIAAGGLDAEPTPPDEEDGLHAWLRAQLDQVERDAEAAGVLLPIRLVQRRFALTPLALEALLLAAAMDLDEPCARAMAVLRGGARHGYVDPQTCLRLLAVGATERLAAWPVFQPDAPLLRAGLLELWPVHGAPPYRAAACLSAPGHTLGLLRGERRLSADLVGAAERVVSPLVVEQLPGLAAPVDALATVIAGLRRLPLGADPIAGRAAFDLDSGALVALSGVEGSGRSLIARAAAARHGQAVIEVDGAVTAGREDWDRVLLRAVQEAELYSELVHVRSTDALVEHRPAAPAVITRLARRRAVVVVLSHGGDALPDPLEGDLLLRLKTPMRLVGPELDMAWQANIPGRWSLDPSVRLRELSETHPLIGGQIRSAVRLAELRAAARAPAAELVPVTHADLDDAAREQRRSYVGELTVDTDEGVYGWTLDDLVLPEATRARINEIERAARHRTRVLRDWGLGRLLGRGTGLVCLFDGAPGTGKTLTAEVLARALDLELHRINVSQVVDKYIGETEKNLTRLFAQLDPRRTLLLFDEADSLFGARVEVRTSTDHYANMAVNTLLQLVERHTGLVILTTNLRDRIDSAFERRITYKVTFERPDPAMRRAIWAAHLPPEAPLVDVNTEELAEAYELSGGSIKNVVLRAALAAAETGRITQALLEAEAEREARAAGVMVRGRPS